MYKWDAACASEIPARKMYWFIVSVTEMKLKVTFSHKFNIIVWAAGI